jgi:hypothetical protein
MRKSATALGYILRHTAKDTVMLVVEVSLFLVGSFAWKHTHNMPHTMLPLLRSGGRLAVD